MLIATLPAAHADELADLEANQQLLQRELEQLAQVPDAGTKAVPGVAVTGGSFPRSFLIPGTDTSLRVGGEVRLSVDYLLTGGGQNASGLPTNTLGSTGLLETTPLNVRGQTVPGLGAVPADLNASRSHFVMFVPRESRIHIETRTPTEWGEAATVFEFDFNGGNIATDPAQVSNSLIPRLRHAYATLGPWLVGQTYPFQYDISTHNETLDFGSDAGYFGPSRQPQIRFTGQLPYIAGGAFAVELDQPDTDVQTAVGKFDADTTTAFPSTVGTKNPADGTVNPAVSPAPDLIGGLEFDRPWTHMRLAAVVRDLKLNDGRFINRQFIGYGGALMGWTKPGWFGLQRDVIDYGFGAGDGLGREINGSTDSGLDTNYGAFPITTATAAKSVIAKTVTGWGGWAGYSHYWLPNLHSNFTFGIRHSDYHSTLIGPAQDIVADKQLLTAHVNLIYAPVPFADVGIEYFWGQRQVVANLTGNISAVLTRVRMRF
ncbi:MAG TPA: DcaP family trimeric outer membrane transporter [Stellaceae bacterium]|nr:DcaP family trimeric outer membrane transporter [Stellaceae bacterium]